MSVPPTEFPIDESSLFARFSRAYNGVPVEERKNAIVIINGEPISWEMAYREIKHDTELGKKIGEKLIRLKII
jgi:hypothetical protein